MEITSFYLDNLLLTDSVEVMPIEIVSANETATNKYSLLLNYKCVDQWGIGFIKAHAEDEERDDFRSHNIYFTLFSQMISVSFLQGYSVLTFYTGVILLLGY